MKSRKITLGLFICPRCGSIHPNDFDPKQCMCYLNRDHSFLGIERYREHWKELHQYAVLNKKPWNAKKAELWLLDWESRIPDYGCSCGGGWQKIKAEVYLNSETCEAFFRWTVKVHNKVNAKLNKPTITYEEACLIHGF